MDYTKTYATLVEVTYFCEGEEEEHNETVLIYARDMHDVADFIEAYYGSDASQVNTTFLGDTVVKLGEEAVDRLMRNDNWDLKI